MDIRAHRITVAGRIRFASSREKAISTRTQMLEALEEPEARDQIEPINIPIGKAALIPWLNNLMCDQEAIVSFPDEIENEE